MNPELRRIGREIIGPAFVFFVRRIVERSRELGLQRLFFLSREGALFQKLYAQWGKLPTHYLHVSRLSTALPAIQRFGPRELRIARHRPGVASPRALLRTFGITDSDAIDRLHAVSFSDLDAAIDYDDARYSLLAKDEGFQTIVHALATDARTKLRRHLERNDYFADRTVGIVDIGWAGTIEDALVNAFPDGPEVHGLYFAVRDLAATYGDPARLAHKQGLFVDYRRHASLPHSAVFHFVELFEQSARSLEGTTLGYDDIGPVLKSGDPSPAVEALQAGILEAAAVREAELWRAIERLVFFPTSRELEALSTLTHAADWGSDDHTQIGVPTLNPRELWLRYHRSSWRPALMARIGLPGLPALYHLYVRLRGR